MRLNERRKTLLKTKEINHERARGGGERMTEQEIERCLERFAMGKACDVMNFDYAGTLAYLQRLKAENAALRERLDKAVDKTIVSEMLAKYFDCPCNFSPLDEEMWAYCRDNCVDDNIECWIRVINKKCAELKGEKK